MLVPTPPAASEALHHLRSRKRDLFESLKAQRAFAELRCEGGDEGGEHTKHKRLTRDLHGHSELGVEEQLRHLQERASVEIECA